MEALQQWTFKGVPENAIGWIYKVAKYKMINIVEKDRIKRNHASNISQLDEISTTDKIDSIFTEKEITDDQLKMIFTCCHPAISPDSQVALTLKTLCGFSIPEIANAFLTTEENINKRLVRAHKTI